MQTGLELFLCGDVMTGRGIDQILPFPGDPVLHEPYVGSAARYVHLGEEVHGQISKPVDFTYIWGDALPELVQAEPDVRLINLETAVTTNGEWWQGKQVHYRMNPPNIDCLAAARIDCCVLANNHVLDWGRGGLVETLEVLHGAGIVTAGAGLTREEAESPAVLEIPGKGRLLVFACGATSSGIPVEWRASSEKPGLHVVEQCSAVEADGIGKRVAAVKRSGDIAVVSLHWGSNWGYGISKEERDFAHRLVDWGADLIHGHSSHHVKGIEVYRERLILYGCGDFLNDYEGISGYDSFRGDIGLMYFPVVNPETGLVRLRMTPTRIRRFRVNRGGKDEREWLRQVLDREGKGLGTGVAIEADGTLALTWSRNQ